MQSKPFSRQTQFRFSLRCSPSPRIVIVQQEGFATFPVARHVADVDLTARSRPHSGEPRSLKIRDQYIKARNGQWPPFRSQLSPQRPPPGYIAEFLSSCAELRGQDPYDPCRPAVRQSWSHPLSFCTKLPKMGCTKVPERSTVAKGSTQFRHALIVLMNSIHAAFDGYRKVAGVLQAIRPRVCDREHCGGSSDLCEEGREWDKLRNT